MVESRLTIGAAHWQAAAAWPRVQTGGHPGPQARRLAAIATLIVTSADREFGHRTRDWDPSPQPPGPGCASDSS